MPVPTARGVAADVLVRVHKDAAFAAAALDAELERAVQLAPRDRALATELVYGTLRYHRWLEARLTKHASRGLGGLDVRVRAILLVAAYQILVLERVPAFAAVNEAVSLARASKGGGARVAGFVNAVLRKVASDPRPTKDDLARAAMASAERPIVEALVRSLGKEGARRLFGEGETLPPPAGLRIEDAATRDEWLVRLREARPEATFERGALSPHAILAWGAGRLVELPGYAEGAWTPQEQGSQAIALALEAKPGDVVLDACAGRGNKTGLLARAVGPSGAVDAADLHASKLARLREELLRIGQKPRETYAVDWSVGNGDVAGPYDGVLVDAPCSGTGTLRRRPEILLRRTETDLASLAALQKKVLARAAALVKPGGRLVYAVCSVLREEAEEVVAIAPELGLSPYQPSFRFPRAAEVGEPGAESDGYFVATFVADNGGRLE